MRTDPVSFSSVCFLSSLRHPPFCNMTAPQYSPLVQSATILQVSCPSHEPCVVGLSAELCDSCVQSIGDAWNASGLSLEDFSAAILIQITSHQSPPVSHALDAVGHLAKETWFLLAVWFTCQTSDFDLVILETSFRAPWTPCLRKLALP